MTTENDILVALSEERERALAEGMAKGEAKGKAEGEAKGRAEEKKRKEKKRKEKPLLNLCRPVVSRLKQLLK